MKKTKKEKRTVIRSTEYGIVICITINPNYPIIRIVSYARLGPRWGWEWEWESGLEISKTWFDQIKTFNSLSDGAIPKWIPVPTPLRNFLFL